MASSFSQRAPSLAALALVAGTACAAATVTPPPATVTVAPPPPAASATPAARAASPDEPGPSPPAPEDLEREACQERLREATMGPFTTLEQCDELRVTLVNIRNDCEPSGGEVSRSFDDSTDCIAEVNDANFKKWLASLSAPHRRRQEAAVKDFAAGQTALCHRACGGDYYRAHCQVGLMSCYGRLVERAMKGELALDVGKPERKLTRAFQKFATALCALPGSAWKGKKPPPGCVDRALASLETCPGPDPADCPQE